MNWNTIETFNILLHYKIYVNPTLVLPMYCHGMPQIFIWNTKYRILFLEYNSPSDWKLGW